MRSNLGTVSASSRRPETGFGTMSTQLNDHTERGMGGRQYGTSEDIETLQGENNASTSRFRAVEECGSSLARRTELARIIRPCHRRVYRVVLFRTASFIQPNCRPSLPVLSRTEEHTSDLQSPCNIVC